MIKHRGSVVVETSNSTHGRSTPPDIGFHSEVSQVVHAAALSLSTLHDAQKPLALITEAEPGLLEALGQLCTWYGCWQGSGIDRSPSRGHRSLPGTHG
jgi:hypothetical protein